MAHEATATAEGGESRATGARARADYPLSLYDYDAEGRHGEPITIGSDLALELMMETAVLAALDEGRELRIVDRDDYVVLHAVGGRIVWPTRRLVQP